MKRAFYFFNDRLNITYSERITMLFLGGLILVLTGASTLYSGFSNSDDFSYDTFIEAFEERAELKNQRQQELSNQYYPQSDPTVTAKEISNKVEESETITGAASVRIAEDTPETELSHSASTDKIDINKAGSAELVELPGIGPAIAERIIEYRKKNGPFKSIEDIKNVRGIGEVRFNDIKDKIKVSD